ncbi:MAG: AAA family ATPase [Bacteroidaceae bacterium]|nr:AAA family ATPase [Bacteroidaceae bacterium]
MALYKEILHYSLGISREHMKTLLLYSRYPKLFDIRLGQKQIAEALSIRNGIVAIERTLRSEDCLPYLLSLKEEDFCTTEQKSSFYLRYKQRAILSFLETLRQAEPIVLKYVCRMTMFMQREQFLAKLGNEQIDTDHGFAQTWLTDVATKRELGNMITDVTIHPQCDDTGTITHLQAILPLSNDDVQSNFREGDTITLYQRNSSDDTIVTRQSIRCVIEEMLSGHWLLQLSHPQRNVSFLKRDNLYAIEPAHIDAGFASSYRGLFSLLTCLPDRRRLILGQRQPEYGEIAPLSVPLKDETTRTIVQNVVRARDYYLLVGPPGTGKTNVALRSIVLELLGSLHENENILLLAYTNRAVDEICEMLENLPDTPDYIRIGKELSCSPRYRNRLLDHVTSACTSRQKLLQRLGPVRVFCGTVTTLCGTPELFIIKRFHTAIIDEASQVLEPQLMPLLTRTHQLPNNTLCNAIGRFIFIGDHKQLPAVVVQPEIQSRVEDEALHQIGITDCRLSLFERLHRNLLSFRLPHLCGYLERQGRMHPDICSFVTEHYYAQHLREVPLPHQQRDLQWTLPEPCTDMERAVATHRLLAYDVLPEPGEENNKANRAEAVVVADLVSALCRLHETSGRTWNPATGVGIIVPFRGQIAMIRRELEAHGVPDYQFITIDTVERYQGSQREVIIFSTVVRQNYQLQILSSPSAMAEGYWVDRKLNVAITRAREQFFLVGNHKLLRKTKDYNALLTYIASQQHQ